MRSAAIGSRSVMARRLGTAGFLFFLVKGLLWVAGAACVYAWR